MKLPIIVKSIASYAKNTCKAVMKILTDKHSKPTSLYNKIGLKNVLTKYNLSQDVVKRKGIAFLIKLIKLSLYHRYLKKII